MTSLEKSSLREARLAIYIQGKVSVYLRNIGLKFSIKFKYKPGTNHGSAILKVNNKKSKLCF